MQGEPAVHQEEEEEEAAGFIGELAEEVEKWGGPDRALTSSAAPFAGSRKEKVVSGALAKTKTEEFKYILMHPFKHEWPTWNAH